MQSCLLSSMLPCHAGWASPSTRWLSRRSRCQRATAVRQTAALQAVLLQAAAAAAAGCSRRPPSCQACTTPTSSRTTSRLLKVGCAEDAYLREHALSARWACREALCMPQRQALRQQCWPAGLMPYNSCWCTTEWSRRCISESRLTCCCSTAGNAVSFMTCDGWFCMSIQTLMASALIPAPCRQLPVPSDGAGAGALAGCAPGCAGGQGQGHGGAGHLAGGR
jgi:hypothetical protein